MLILLVDDEERLINFLKRGLQEEGYSVDVALDGVEALEKIKKQNYDLIILDVMLPKKDGFALLQEIRSRNIFTPILMLSARGAAEDRVKGLDLGADDYLPKPFYFDELVARIRSLLRRSSTEKHTILRCGDLELDTVKRIAYRGGRQIELTNREFALLEYMLRNKGKVLSRTRILANVWNYNFDPESNIVDVYVKRLRQKIEQPNKPKLIHSIRGMGYLIHEPEEPKWWEE